MSGVQVLVLILGVVNVVAAIGPADAMTWRTHEWGRQLVVMACGVMAAGCSWLGWVGVDLEFALCGQLVVLAVLLHMRDHQRQQVMADAMAEQQQRAPVRARGEHAQ